MILLKYENVFFLNKFALLSFNLCVLRFVSYFFFIFEGKKVRLFN